MSPSTREVTISARVPARVPVSLTPTSWTAHRDLSIADWVEQGRWLGALARASGWWIGDWLRYGTARYGDKYAPTAAATGYDVQSLMNMAYVAGRFAAPRRRVGLSFSHHAELAGLAPEEQELWLDRAEAEAMSVRALRHELRETRRRVAARVGRAETANGDDPDPSGAVCPRCGHHFGL